MITKIDAIKSLCPKAEFAIIGDEVKWFDKTKTQPTDAQIADEIVRLQAAFYAFEYQRKRAAEYPPMADYLDAIVKSDQAQIDKYIADCLAVKAKYPKPQE